MYAQERRRVTGRKTNFTRDAQPYIFSNLPLESFELDLFTPGAIFKNKKNSNYKILFCVDTISKYLFTEIVKSKTGDDIKKALGVIFKKIEKMQNTFPSHIHLKRLCTGDIIMRSGCMVNMHAYTFIFVCICTFL